MRLLAVLRCLVFAACTIGDEAEGEGGSEEPADYEIDPADGKGDGLIAPTFDRHSVVGNNVFVNDGKFTVDEVQRFLERSPYGTRSWLADYRVNGISAAQAIVNAAEGSDIHPMMLLARMQVEATLVSKRPSQYRIDRALGCGCHDGRSCSSQFLGLDKQLACGADTLRKWYDASMDGTGDWRLGHTKRTLDPASVTPRNHATASLYAYTPWVLVNRGGNWLVWNVTRKYVRHAEAAGYLVD